MTPGDRQACLPEPGLTCELWICVDGVDVDRHAVKYVVVQPLVGLSACVSGSTECVDGRRAVQTPPK
jgi:hypothetical protein